MVLPERMALETLSTFQEMIGKGYRVFAIKTGRGLGSYVCDWNSGLLECSISLDILPSVVPPIEQSALVQGILTSSHSPAHRQFSSAPRSSAGLLTWFLVRSVEDTQHPGPGVGNRGER
jgi:hypothetical protein